MMSMKMYWNEGGVIAVKYALAEAVVQVLLLRVLGLFAPKDFTRKEKLDITNRCIASLHAITMFSRTIYYWWNINPTFVIPLEMSEYHNLTNDLMVGYLIYDTISEIFVIGNLDLMMLGHHVVGIGSHVTCRINSLGACAYYHMMVYISEGSTPFLHISWILKSFNMKDTALFKVCVVFLLILFFLVRLLWGPYMQYDLHIRQEHWFMTDAGKSLYWPNVACVLFFNIVNFAWGHKLFSIALKSVTAGGGDRDDAPAKKTAAGGKGKSESKGKKKD